MSNLQQQRAKLIRFRSRVNRLLEQYDFTSRYYFFLVMRKISINQQITLLDQKIMEVNW